MSAIVQEQMNKMSNQCPLYLTYGTLFSPTDSWFPDGSDSPGGGGGFLPILAPASHRPPVGGVWDLPIEPGLLRATDHCTLPRLQQLLCEPGHLRLPVGELPEGLQAGVQVSDRQQRLATQRHQGDS